MRTRAALLTALGLLAGCYKFTSFTCATDGDCGTGGTCQAVGFCSFPDPTCSGAGQRFGDFSGTYADQCVGAVPTDAGFDAPIAPIDGPPKDVGGGGGALQRTITIDPTKVAAAQVDFPVWIDLTDAGIAAHARSDASDLYFTAADTSTLDFEIERYDAASGHLLAWVRVPALSASAVSPTAIVLRYGESGASPPANAPGVFSSSFVAVWHMDDALATPAVADATGAHAGSAVGLTPGAQVAGQLGGGIAFPGGTSEVTFTNPLTGAGPHTISLWLNEPGTGSDNQIIFAIGNGVSNQSRWFKSRFHTADLAVGFFANDWADTTRSVVGDGWTKLDWVFDGATAKSHMYIDGAEIAGSPFTHTNGIATAGAAGYIGNAPAAWGNPIGLTATVDELRFATVARPASWIATEFANQSSPATFYTLGAEQPVP